MPLSHKQLRECSLSAATNGFSSIHLQRIAAP
uniref:Uncharacterized protein n=1 Tax=Rhizophora mucronata TaxID=61149 RepID=A0A2P2IMX5_RHIMU